MKEPDTLYRKFVSPKGKVNYLPVRDCEAYNGLGNGCWLVLVENGCTSIRKLISPDTSAIEAACRKKENKIVNYLAKASEARLKSVPLTPKEKKAVDAYYAIMGNEKFLYFEYLSLHGMAEEILRLLLEEE